MNLKDRMALVPCELTAENGAKAALIGEFAFANGEAGMAVVPWTTIKEIHREVVKLFGAAGGRTSDEEALILHAVLNQARETLLVGIRGTPEDLARSLGKLNLACKAHWDWQTAKESS
jgi:hypothetical protein